MGSRLYCTGAVTRARVVRQEAPTERPERIGVTDAERIHDTEQKIRCWGCLSHYISAEREMGVAEV